MVDNMLKTYKCTNSVFALVHLWVFNILPTIIIIYHYNKNYSDHMMIKKTHKYTISAFVGFNNTGTYNGG